MSWKLLVLQRLCELLLIWSALIQCEGKRAMGRNIDKLNSNLSCCSAALQDYGDKTLAKAFSPWNMFCNFSFFLQWLYFTWPLKSLWLKRTQIVASGQNACMLSGGGVPLEDIPGADPGLTGEIICQKSLVKPCRARKGGWREGCLGISAQTFLQFWITSRKCQWMDHHSISWSSLTPETPMSFRLNYLINNSKVHLPIQYKMCQGIFSVIQIRGKKKSLLIW